MAQHPEHVRRHAQRHAEAHQELKELLKKLPPKEKVGRLFVGTFAATLLILGMATQWNRITGWLTPAIPPPLPPIHGFKMGILSSHHLHRQTSITYEHSLQKIATQGSVAAVKVTQAISKIQPKPLTPTLVNKSALATRLIAYYKTTPSPLISENAARTSVWMTNYLGQGLQTTPVRKVQNLEKSVLTTYYLGEKSANINSTLAIDTRLLQSIKNALSVDLFQLLNQSKSRADALSDYLKLLQQIDQKITERRAGLTGAISLLQGNATGLGTRIEVSEQTFFQQLDKLDGPLAEENLANFIGLRQQEGEVRAKLGAYRKLYSYYQIFQPRIQDLMREIQLNREALIAGVKVIEIQNMQLPLIIREKR